MPFLDRLFGTEPWADDPQPAPSATDPSAQAAPSPNRNALFSRLAAATDPGRPTAPASTAGTPPQLQAPQSYGEFAPSYIRAAQLNEKLHPEGSLFGFLNWISGVGRDAATANAEVEAPLAYAKLAEAQTGAAAGQLDLAQTRAFLQRAGTHLLGVQQDQPAQGAQPAPQPAAPQGQYSLQPQAWQPAPQGQPQPAVDPIKAAILQQESGNNSGVAPSVNGAVGPGQITPATFAQYAQPGEDINNPADNRAVSGRIIDDYTKRYGGDAGRVATAYFSGPGNVAPAGSPTPWINDAKDGNGKSVSSYVGDLQARTGAGQPPAQGPTDPTLFPRLAASIGTPSLPAGIAATQPTAGQPQSGDPIQQQRSFLARQAQALSGLPKFLPQALELQKELQAGAPPGTIIGPDGLVHDGGNGSVLPGSYGEIEAGRAGQSADATARAQQPYVDEEARNQGAVTIGVNRQKAIDDANLELTPVAGADGRTHMITRGQAAAAALGGNSPITGFADPDIHKAQVEEIQKAQAEGGEAARQQSTVQQLGQALKNAPITGPGAETAVGILKVADSLGLLSQATRDKLASGEFARTTSVEVAGVLAKEISNGRTPVAIFNQVASKKPQLGTSEPQLLISALNQDLQRAQDKARFTADYYQQGSNAGKLDAQSAFEKAYPIGLYESRVTPLSLPGNPENAKPGFTYATKRGPAVWTGQQFVPAGAK